MINSEPSSVEYAVQINNLSFGWRTGLPLINLQSLNITKGAKVFIKGASGSGKSTLLSLIGGVLPPQTGSISVLGQSFNQLTSAQRDRFRADHIGFIFQMFNLIPYLTALENVLLPCNFSKKRRLSLLERNKTLQDEAERLLHYLDLPMNLWQRPATELSVGQQQRVAVARALIGGPELVIADEPTSALDTERRNAFMELLLKECQHQNTTLVFVSHDPTLRCHFDRHIDLEQINMPQ